VALKPSSVSFLRRWARKHDSLTLACSGCWMKPRYMPTLLDIFESMALSCFFSGSERVRSSSQSEIDASTSDESAFAGACPVR
jgi:hypothetical protein